MPHFGVITLKTFKLSYVSLPPDPPGLKISNEKTGGYQVRNSLAPSGSSIP